MPHDHDHDHDHPHAEIGEDSPPGYYDLMTRAVTELLVERGLIEPGEIRRQIEVLDSRTPALGAAVVARADDAGVSIAAFVAMKPARKGSIIAMKRHITAYLPHYMVPDQIAFLPALPMTSTDKVDYQTLKGLAPGPGAS